MVCQIMHNIENSKPERVTGLKHIFAASLYSIGGIKRLWCETAFRHELVFASLILLFLCNLGAQIEKIVISTILILLLIAVEALNTAIECMVDHISPTWAGFARDAKDLGSLAVLCMLMANGIYFIYVAYPLAFPSV